jgi:hypothetical protein
MSWEFISNLLLASVRMATPLIFLTLAELYSQRAGLVHIGLEGLASIGSLVGFLVSLITGNPFLGVLAGAAAGILDVCQGGATMGLRETRLLRRMFSYARRPKGGALFLPADPVILMQMTRRFSRCCKYIHQNRIFCE